MTENRKLQAEQLLQASRQALQNGSRGQARDFALHSAELDPSNEECWLILAALASPQASVAYLQNALRINPSSERARQGMQWAMERIQKESRNVASPLTEEATKPNLVSPPIPPLPVPDSQSAPIKTQTIPEPTQELEPVDALRRELHATDNEGNQAIVFQTPQAVPSQKRPSHLSLWLAIPLTAVILACIGLVGFFSLSYRVADASSAAAAQVPTDALFKPSLTPTATITPTATNTPLPTPTGTPTPIPTETPEILPASTLAPVIVYHQPPVGIGAGERWIDVDLSNQMVYAYEGDTLVGSFLVSTGTAAHPTVTGQYHIYVKYRYDDMSGPGYYLPDVPFVMYFYAGYGLHGTYWHHNFGHPMSHGCINMYTPDAEWLFNWASVGTLVNIHY